MTTEQAKLRAFRRYIEKKLRHKRAHFGTRIGPWDRPWTLPWAEPHGRRRKEKSCCSGAVKRDQLAAIRLRELRSTPTE